MKCYVNVIFYRTYLIIMTILIICSFLLQGILYLEPIGLLRFRRIIESILQVLHIGAFAAELYHRVSAFIWQLICNIMQLNYPLNFKFTYLFNEDLDDNSQLTSHIIFSCQSFLPLMLENLTFIPTLFGYSSLCVMEQLKS